jgi:hypothetical protein
MREKHQLTAEEQKDFRRLNPEPGEAIEFWGGVAHRRGLDYTTILADAPNFTAMPYGHNRPWCYPIRLKCRRRVKYTEPVPDIATLMEGQNV